MLVVNAANYQGRDWITSRSSDESVELKNVSSEYCQLALQDQTP